jgi:hypothetical protein
MASSKHKAHSIKVGIVILGIASKRENVIHQYIMLGHPEALLQSILAENLGESPILHKF